MLRSIFLLLFLIAALAAPEPCRSADNRTLLPIQEEVWALPLIHPTVAYVVRPVGNGPFPLAVMNHGVSLNARERGFFPLVEFRDAAIWFARRGYLVVAPTGPGYGAMALEASELGLFPVFYSKIGACENPNFQDAGMAAALLDKWIIDYMIGQKYAVPDSTIVIGQSAGGWGAIALSSQNLPSVKAIITFAAGRGGRVGGVRSVCANPDAVDLYRERYVLRAGSLPADACRLYRCRRQRRISFDAAIRQRRTFLYRFPRCDPAMVTACQSIPGQASLGEENASPSCQAILPCPCRGRWIASVAILPSHRPAGPAVRHVRA
jgi:pimeloyl-ACP methyl ester carboxylesterase